MNKRSINCSCLMRMAVLIVAMITVSYTEATAKSSPPHRCSYAEATVKSHPRMIMDMLK